jgi:hypothetical protein
MPEQTHAQQRHMLAQQPLIGITELMKWDLTRNFMLNASESFKKTKIDGAV